MTDGREHPRDALHELLDGRLAGAERVALDEHLASCARCRAELALLDAARGAAHESLASEHAPPGLEARVRAALDRDDEVRAAFEARGQRKLPRAVWAAGWILSTVLAVVLVFAWTRLDFPAESARDFRALSRGQLALSLRTGDPAGLERRLAEGGISFTPRVLDLGMMGWRLAGGRVNRFARRPSALFAYQDDRGRWLVCQMFFGNVDELPREVERRAREGIDFFVYERDGVTSVFWREGTVVCLLASDLPRAEVVQLAFAFAMKAV
ncbi:MAG: zf-HC2 domain-containing protein [Acidobacteria bacterium]|jgi:anti-sigma factor RsiW|nr:zf-HC2 domain-containing protein [Acidobacteriota bacterium]